MISGKACVVCGLPICRRAVRCKSCAVRHRYEVRRNKSLEEETVSLYASGASLNAVATAVCRSKSWVYSVIQANMPLRSISEGRRVYKLNQQAFQWESREKYHVLGLFATDGCISRNRSSHVAQLSLHRRDEDILEAVRCFFDTDKPLSSSEDQRVLSLYSKRICDDLRSYGIVERKSLRLALRKKIPSCFVRDFLLGCFEGDGSLTKDALDLCICSSASEVFINQISQLVRILGYSCAIYSYVRNRKHRLFHAKLYGSRALEFLEDMYGTDCSSMKMRRKHSLFLRHQERFK